MKLLTALAVVLALAGAAAGVWMLRERARPKHPPAPKVNVHGAGIDREMSAVRAMHDAPPGANDCESAYNGFKAADDLGKSGKAHPIIVRLAPRDEFLAECARLPAATQKCLVPTYLPRHREECKPLRPEPELLKKLVELTLPGQILQPAEPPPTSELPPPQ